MEKKATAAERAYYAKRHDQLVLGRMSETERKTRSKAARKKTAAIKGVMARAKKNKRLKGGVTSGGFPLFIMVKRAKKTNAVLTRNGLGSIEFTPKAKELIRAGA